MDNSQNQLQCSPCFPINSDTFTFNSSKLKSIQKKMYSKAPYISSPLCLQRQSPSEASNSHLSNLISPKEPNNSLSFKDIQKPSPYIINTKSSAQSLNEFFLSNSSDPGSSSRNNQRSPRQEIDNKDKPFLLPNTKYSSRYQESNSIIEEDPHEESFHLKQLRSSSNRSNRSLIVVIKKDNHENESKRMIKEMLKLSNATNRIAEDYNIKKSNGNNNGNSNNGNINSNRNNDSSINIKEDKSQNKKPNANEECTCSTEDNDEDIDEETKLLCFLSIPRMIYKNNKKQLLCCSLKDTNTKDTSYDLLFKDINSMTVSTRIPMKSITLCTFKSNMQFIIQYISNKTFVKTTIIIETKSIEDCNQYVSGINLILLQRKLHS